MSKIQKPIIKHSPNIILVSTDSHTLGMQTVGCIIRQNKSIEPTMYFLPSNLRQYPEVIEQKIISHINSKLDNEHMNIIAFSVKSRSSLKLKSRSSKIFSCSSAVSLPVFSICDIIITLSSLVGEYITIPS